MTALVLSSHHATEHLLPLAHALVAEDFVVLRGIDGLAATLANDEKKQKLWIFDQATFLAHASDLVRWSDRIELNLCIRRRGGSHLIDTTVTALVKSDFSFRVWTLQRSEFSHQVEGVGSVTVRSLLPENSASLKADNSAPRYQVATGSLLIEPADPDKPNQTQKAQAFAIPPLVNSARRGEPLPDCTGATADERDLVHAVWALKDKDREALQQESRELEVLFCIPNGLGLGHLSRTLAVAQALEHKFGLAPEQIGFWSYSLASTLITEAGYRVAPRQTAKQLGIDGKSGQRGD